MNDDVCCCCWCWCGMMMLLSVGWLQYARCRCRLPGMLPSCSCCLFCPYSTACCCRCPGCCPNRLLLPRLLPQSAAAGAAPAGCSCCCLGRFYLFNNFIGFFFPRWHSNRQVSRSPFNRTHSRFQLPSRTSSSASEKWKREPTGRGSWMEREPTGMGNRTDGERVGKGSCSGRIGRFRETINSN